MNYDNKFDVRSTNILKGFAIILMVCNHLYPIPEWIYPSNQFISLQLGSKTLAAYFGGFSKICVAIFAFLSGYGMYYTYKKHESIIDGYKHNLHKLINFLLTYWLIICCFYIPIMKVSGVLRFDLKDFVLNLFALRTTYIRIAWYVRFYIILVISFPVYILIFLNNKNDFSYIIKRIFILILLGILKIIFECIVKDGYIAQKMILEYANYTPIVLMGFYFAEVGVFERMDLVVKKVRFLNTFFIEILCLGIIFLMRGVIKNLIIFNADLIYAPILIFIIWEISSKCNYKVNNLLAILGKYSLEIWFLHAIFFIGNESVQKIAYWPKYSILIIIWTTVILLPFAYVFKKIKSLLIKLVERK